MHEFKEYPPNYYGSRFPHPFWYIFPYFFVIFLFPIIMGFQIILIDTNLIFITYFSINYILIYAKKMKIQDYLRYHHLKMVKNQDESQSKTNTICKTCAVKLSTNMFKNRNEEFIKQKIFFLSIKGYFCKKCYKKYSFLFIIDIFLLFLLLIISIIIRNYLEYGVVMMIYVIEFLFFFYIIPAFGISLLVFILDYSKYLRLYNV